MDPYELEHQHTRRHAKVTALLQRRYGYSGFRAHQYRIIREIILGRDVCAVLPTGYGKSLTYQIPAIYTRRPAVVVSPLISLMADQCASLQRIGVPACAFNSEVADRGQMLREIRAGEYQVIYITPESLVRGVVREVLQSVAQDGGLSVIAIDEAHCISSYGFDFRSDYRKLSELREQFPGVPILAVTATATEEVAEDICQVLGLEVEEVIKSSFDRPNLHLEVRRRVGEGDVLSCLAQHPDSPAIVYCLTRAVTEKIATMLRSHGILAGHYHGACSEARKRKTHHAFLDGKLQVVVATIAFGMGIDKPDVRTVIHYGCPRNLEGYYQEIGRAGRDGAQSHCYLLYHFSDFRTQQHFIADKTDPGYQATLTQLLQIMKDYVTSDICRRRILLAYFGDEWDTDCGKCDNCCGGVEMRREGQTAQDVTTEVRMFLALCQSVPAKFGKTMWIDVLRGSKAAKIVSNKMVPDLPRNLYYGAGRGHSVKWWKELVDLMQAKNILRQTCLGGRFNACVVEPSAEALAWYYGTEDPDWGLEQVSMTECS